MANTGVPDGTPYFDKTIVGIPVQADGGNAAVGSRFGSREMFEGSLTGRRMDVGLPAWRWLEIGDLTSKPENFEEDFVWCEVSYVYPLDPAGPRIT